MSKDSTEYISGIDATIEKPPMTGLFQVVVIPCCNEPALLTTLHSLKNCKPASHPVEVIIVVNAAEGNQEAMEQNRITAAAFHQWNKAHRDAHIVFHMIERNDLPSHRAGAGLARKIGMDMAARRLKLAGTPKGIILSLDADCRVSDNYLSETEHFFLRHPSAIGCVFRFEHPLQGDEFPDRVYQAIAEYELYLRYFHEGLKWSGYPYPFHTIGSCMAVRSDIYRRAGGMNQRKAGEDFYFLQKIFPMGDFYELASVCVYPSPRPSSRLPFGTAHAVYRILNNGQSFRAFNLQSFADLKTLNEKVIHFFSEDQHNLMQTLPVSVQQFFKQRHAASRLQEIRSNTASPAAFRKRFYQWFNRLMVLQFFHFCRDHFYADLPLDEAARELISLLYGQKIEADKMAALHFFREVMRAQSDVC
jgi:hypothetical protein